MPSQVQLAGTGRAAGGRGGTEEGVSDITGVSGHPNRPKDLGLGHDTSPMQAHRALTGTDPTQTKPPEMLQQSRERDSSTSWQALPLETLRLWGRG